MEPCVESLPKAIDDEFLRLRIKTDTEANGEEGRLALLEGIQFNEVEKITMEYSSILRMDHLWILSNLKILVLSNNFISKIEKIDTLVHLNELDLSFNKILEIDGLSTLVNLKKLSLFSNQISIIKNLENLQKLELLSLGRNQISDQNQILALRPLESLKSFNMEENPCSGDENFRLFVVVFLPNLVYYHYRMISSLEREVGLEIFRDQYQKFVAEETTIKEAKALKDKIELDAIQHSKCFVEYLNSDQLYKNMFEKDVDGQLLIEISEEIKDLANELKENITKTSQNIFEFGLEEYNLRELEIQQYNECVNGTKMKNQQKSIDHLEDFLTKKSHTFETIKKCSQKVFTYMIALQEYYDIVSNLKIEYENDLHELWKYIMELELELNEQINEVNDALERALTDRVSQFIETTQGFFSEIRDFAVDYNDNVGDVAKKLAGMYESKEDVEEKDVNLELLKDKDALINALGTSHDYHMLMIDTREDTLILNSKTWLENLIANLQKSELARNREKIIEISTFIDVQKEEFQQISSDSIKVFQMQEESEYF